MKDGFEYFERLINSRALTDFRAGIVTTALIGITLLNSLKIHYVSTVFAYIFPPLTLHPLKFIEVKK